MPKREDEEEIEYGPEKQYEEQETTSIDLSYLPEELQKKITTIFDRYFAFGFVKYRKEDIDGDDVAPFPNKISGLTSPALGDLQSQYSGWHGFTLDKLKYVAVARTVLDAELQKTLDAHLGSMVADKGNLDLKTAKAKSEPDYVAILSYKIELDGLYSMVKTEADRYEKQLSTISREISRRESNAGY
jgi:hypothetical protein